MAGDRLASAARTVARMPSRLYWCHIGKRRVSSGRKQGCSGREGEVIDHNNGGDAITPGRGGVEDLDGFVVAEFGHGGGGVDFRVQLTDRSGRGR